MKIIERVIKMIKFDCEQEKFIRDNIKGHTRDELTRMFNENFGTSLSDTPIRNFAKKNNLSIGLGCARFKKGHIPKNKGTKGLMKINKTSFKKGNIPSKTKPIGHEYIDCKDGYTHVKIADPNKWELKHILVWKAANGPIPKSHVVMFADQNKTNFNLDNLILLSKKQLLIMNKKNLVRSNPDLTRTGIIIADIVLKSAELKRGKSKGCKNDK